MQDRWVCMICGFSYRGAAPPQNCPSCGAPFTSFQRQRASVKERLRGIKMAQPRPAGFRYVIVGNSAAGRSAAQAIRALDPKGSVTVVSEETAPIYARPLLPDFIAGLDRGDFFSSGRHFEARGIDLMVGVRAERIDLDRKQLLCAGGESLPFDALLLATGSAPMTVPWPGSEAEGIAYFRTFADAEQIAGLVKTARHAVVVGGGLLGLEFVRCFVAAKLKVTQLVRDSRIGGPALDERGAPILEAALRDLGVTVALEEEVVGFEQADGRVSAVRTSKDRTLECDLVGIAVGARPRVELATEAGLTVDRGVLVDASFRSSHPDIYAAGDVAQALDRVAGEPRVNTSWRNSLEQGEQAGIAMAGGEVQYPGALAANYQLAAGLPFCALGLANPPPGSGLELAVEASEQARTYKKTVKRGGELVGACLIGDLSSAGEYEEALRQAHEVGFVPPPQPAAKTDAQLPDVKPQTGGGEPQPERTTIMNAMTEQNLKDAFAGESQAHMKYLNFAARAEEEGKANVARLFRAASYSEQMHASRHLDELKGIGGTSDNLAGAAGGENFEVEQMYPAYIVVAQEQGEDSAQEAFTYALEAEKVHLGLYQRAKEAVDAGGDLEVADIWVCTGCGFTMEGEPPDKCPLCRTPRRLFQKF